MNSKNPLISIITPYYNSEEFLKRTIKSIQSQELSNWELILVDDGSTDGGPQLIDEMLKMDSRISHFKRPSAGYKAGGRGAKNYGFTQSKGQYVVFFDADDFMLPNYLSERINLITIDTNTDVVFTEFGWKVGSDLNVQNIYKYHAEFNLEFSNLRSTNQFWKSYADLNFFWVPSNMLWRKTSIQNLRWNESTTIGEDFEFHCQALLANLNFKCIHKTTWYYMRNDNSMMATSENPAQIEKRSLFMNIVLNQLIESNLLDDSDEIVAHFIKDQYRFIRRITTTKSPRREKWDKIKMIYIRIRSMQKQFKNSLIRRDWRIIYIKSYYIVFTSLLFKKGFQLFDKLLIGKRIENSTLNSRITPANDFL